MKHWKRMAYYLLLNVLVSACTTLGVLIYWDRTHGMTQGNLIPPLASLWQREPSELLSTPLAEGTTAPVDVQISTPGVDDFFAYQVVGGDSFASIAAQYGVSEFELIEVNGFTKDQPLAEGEVLRIPLHPRGSVVLDSVIGAGDLDSEHVLLKHIGEGDLSLVGWQLEDNNGNRFIFPKVPEVTLVNQGAINLYTKNGISTVVDLYWGKASPVWSSGDTLTLKDPEGKVRDTYVIP